MNELNNQAPFPVLMQDFVDYMDTPDDEPKLYLYNRMGFRKALTGRIEKLVDTAKQNPVVADEFLQVLTKAVKDLQQEPLKGCPRHASSFEKVPDPVLYPDIPMEDVLILD